MRRRKNVEVARLHAAARGLTVDYRHATAESLSAEGEAFDAVVAMELLEHVPDVGQLIGHAVELTRPGGAFVLSTLNRTAKAFISSHRRRGICAPPAAARHAPP